MGLREQIAKRKIRRKFRIRKRITGTDLKPRLSVKRTLKHIYVQLISDESQRTLASASTVDSEIKGMITADSTKTACSQLVGKMIAKRALEKNISEVVFDRNGFLYHGRVKAVADAAREAGLKF